MLGTLVLSMRLVRNVRRRLTRAIEDLKNRHRGARTIGIGVAAPVLAVLLICLAATTAVDLILVVAPNYEIPFSWILIHLQPWEACYSTMSPILNRKHLPYVSVGALWITGLPDPKPCAY